MAEVVVAGFICLDIIPPLLGGAQLVPGRMVEAGPAILATGGAGPNTGIALQQLGLPTRLVAKIGDDLFRRAIRTIVESHGPDLSGGVILTPGEGSSYTVVLSPPGADRTFVGHIGCNATFGAADVRDEDLAAARLLHFGY